MFIMGTAVTIAANKTTSTTTTFVTDIKDDSCVAKIKKNISSLGKIEDYEVTLKTKEITVTYNSKKNTDEKIIAGFKEIGYKASVKTEETKTTSSNTSSNSNSNSNNNSNVSSNNNSNSNTSNNNTNSNSNSSNNTNSNKKQ